MFRRGAASQLQFDVPAVQRHAGHPRSAGGRHGTAGRGDCGGGRCRADCPRGGSAGSAGLQRVHTHPTWHAHSGRGEPVGPARGHAVRVARGGERIQSCEHHVVRPGHWRGRVHRRRPAGRGRPAPAAARERHPGSSAESSLLGGLGAAGCLCVPARLPRRVLRLQALAGSVDGGGRPCSEGLPGDPGRGPAGPGRRAVLPWRIRIQRSKPPQLRSAALPLLRPRGPAQPARPRTAASHSGGPVPPRRPAGGLVLQRHAPHARARRRHSARVGLQRRLLGRGRALVRHQLRRALLRVRAWAVARRGRVVQPRPAARSPRLVVRRAIG
mmetsp:Transcript_5549/g.23535  ORF Transcript_5549/g.23535 Transcript_5549/m.23535 type:complete len:327 (-) Transcript_5549:939-1919(-)